MQKHFQVVFEHHLNMQNNFKWFQISLEHAKADSSVFRLLSFSIFRGRGCFYGARSVECYAIYASAQRPNSSARVPFCR